MRRRLPRLVVTTMVIANLMLLGGAPAAWGTPPDPTSGLAGAQARVSQAVADAADEGADVTVAVLDRQTGQVVSARADQSFPIASVAKLFIADDLLKRASEGDIDLSPADRKAIDSMLRSSDDGAAQMFWDRSGGNAVITRIKERYGLAGTTVPWNGHWDVTTSTANDLVRYYDMLLSGAGGLPPAQADIILDNIAQFAPTALDGYPQRFGIADGLYGERVAVKGGWFCCWDAGNQVHVSTGVIGPDRRYVMVISSLQPTGEAAARATITDAVKEMFPGGRI